MFSEFMIGEEYCGRRDGKSQAFATAAFGVNKSIQSNQIAVTIHECSAAVAWIYGSIGLDVHHRTIGIDLPANGAYDASCDRVLKPLRRAYRQHNLAKPNPEIETQGDVR